ncbi:bifunctional ADP-heptose synthase [Desulfonatronospira sp.]|uniref:bifunctional ADP-heptose synthase n=1 Tax=Desulfonatronospira sp. TaxID=1962951 RepID=UPI0025C2B510|nr:bifunctional ADP-heptose synthase [Desulfonatronospira sp.]
MDEPLQAAVLRIRPDIVVKGKEHESKFNPELEVLEQYGGRLLFSSGESSFSSIDLLRKEFTESNPQTIHVPEDYLKRHSISTPGLMALMQRFTSLKVCVVGDLIIDEFITCEPLGMSQEDPTIVVSPLDSTFFLGGAGIVAAHAAGLGGQVTFISVSGEDAASELALDKLSGAGVRTVLTKDCSRPTILKQRFRSKGKTLLRVSRLHQHPISSRLQTTVLENLEDALHQADLLVYSDFNYGFLPSSLVERASSMALARGVMMVADSQSSSQIVDVSRFQGMKMICPTEREARLATRNSEDGLVVLAEQLRKQARADNVLLKLGEEGLLIHAENQDNWLTDRIGALNSVPKDVAGAGDSMLIAGAMTLAAGGDIWEAAFLGSLAAAVQVGRVGNTPVQRQEIMQEFT